MTASPTHATIRGVASAFPPHQADLEYATAAATAMSCENADQARKIGKLYRRTGVQTRGSVLLQRNSHGLISQAFYPPLDKTPSGPSMQTRNDHFSIEAPKLGVRSSADALAKASVSAAEITHLVTVTCTGFTAPGLDVALIKQLQLPATTQRVAVGFMGCHALINGIRVAAGLIAADPGACVLLCSVELCSLHYQYGYDPQSIVSGSLFSDGSAALVLSGPDIESESVDRSLLDQPRSSQQLPSQHLPSPGLSVPQCSQVVLATGSCLLPDCEDAMTWRIGNHGFQMTLSAAVPGLIQQHLAGFLVPWLRQHGHDLSSIGGWAVHPGGVRILQAVEEALNLSDDALDISREVLRRRGNMSSATLGVVLMEFIERDIPGPWLMLGFGPGLEIEVALMAESQNTSKQKPR